MQFKLDIVAPPAEVAALVNTFYVIETQDARIEEIVPAYSAQLVVMIRGRLIAINGETITPEQFEGDRAQRIVRTAHGNA